MAFHAISQELLPQFSDNLEKGSSAFSGRSSLQTAQELGLRHMLHKENRTSARIGDDIYDTKAMNNKASVLSDAAGSTKIGGPTWLSNALMRQQSAATPFLEGDQSSRKWCGCEPAGSHCVHSSFLHLKTQPTAGVSKSSAGKTLPSSCTQWLSNKVDENPGITSEFLGEDVPSESLMGLSTQHSHISAEISRSTSQRGAGLRDIHSEAANNSELIDATDAGDYEKHHNTWQTSSVKADILSHPLYEQLLAAHVACLRIATPVDQIPKIDAQLAQAHSIAAKYSAIGDHHLPVGEEKDELDQFMTHYVLLLCSFKEQLQQHVRVHAMDAVMACWELEQNLVALTGVSPGEGTGATMSDDDDDNEDSDPFLYDPGLDRQDNGGFGPLIPTETERSLMERVRQELKAELKHGYKDRIVDVREEILRKRRAGKLPGDTTSVLKSWWHAHSKWPYPTEDEKARLVQETGLQLKQINNWFINQRKRNWHSNPTSSLKSKRKRG